MKERDIVRRILRVLHENGAYAVKIGYAGYSGTPDILGCIEGRFFALEVKTPERVNLTSRLQRHRLEEIGKAGGVARVVTSVEEALEALREAKECRSP